MVKEEKNKMKNIAIDSVILHGSSADPQKLEKLKKLLKMISGQEPVPTLAKKRIPAFKIRPGLHIGYKVTIKKDKAYSLLKNLLMGVKSLKKSHFHPGFLTFGIKEYIEIPTLSYQRDIGIMGFDVAVTLKRPGIRIVKRKINKSKIGKKHIITKEETIDFFKENFKINIE